MELKEAAVSSLVDYLYTGHLALPSHICRLLELATAAHCFQLQVCTIVSNELSRRLMIYNHGEC